MTSRQGAAQSLAPREPVAAPLRHAFDLAVGFILAVLLLRTFILEGYLISTGSMAPRLCGFHRRIECPSCGCTFPFGVAFDASVEDGTGGIRQPEGLRRLAVCPNCSQSSIDVQRVPDSHGDQLLVLKHTYDLRPPGRWETVVFRNPAAPSEAFLKRVVGLPGERLQLINGDVYINGRAAVKPWQQQLEMRIPLCSLDHIPHNDQWQLPWELDQSWTHVDNRLVGGDDKPSWIRFRYWRWQGGQHPVSTPLDRAAAASDWAAFQERESQLPLVLSARVRYDEQRQLLSCTGVLPAEVQRLLLEHCQNAEFRSAVYRLAALSHLAPVTDRYGYNSMVASPEFIVSDLMLDTRIAWDHPPRSIDVRIPVGAALCGLRIEPAAGRALLVDLDRGTLVAEAPLPASTRKNDSLLLQVSNFDRRIAAAVDGHVLWEGIPAATAGPQPQVLEVSAAPAPGSPADPEKAAEISLRSEQQRRWALGTSAGRIHIEKLSMFRDVFYTPPRHRKAAEYPPEYLVEAGSYFVQGDNSPVSSDSRSWTHPCVPHSHLVGKPFLVHLPSRPAILQFAGVNWPIRLPDWNRIRRIH
jgi:signal peptidase I